MLARNLLRTALAFPLALSFSTVSLAESKFSFDTTPGQLSKDVIPQHYALTIQPDMKLLTFKGSEIVDIDVRQASNTIVLNAMELNISRASLLGAPGQIASVRLDDKEQTISLTFPQTIRAGRHKLQIAFDGKIGAQSQGLYYVEYPTDHGEKIMLATQMEPTDARRMFPCWDEPVYRSTYQLTVVTAQDLMAVSNTSVETEKPAGPGLKSITFGRTPKMSSYLVVLVAGELETLTGDSEGVPVRVVTTHGKKDTGRYALATVRKLLPYFNEYFGIKYPLPKLDLIAIPGGFSGAMENWGGITFQESLLLFDPTTSSQDTKAAIFSVLSHEVAHQWFGDLVTMAWWNNLWLNEGFASWIGTKATDHFNPEWRVWLRQHSYKNVVMSLDARKTTHPIQQPVNTPAEANRVFDEITYGKGEAFLRMMETFIGEAAFREGIRAYMRLHQYSNTTTADLWEALGKKAGKRISTIASNWTEQPGFPLITAKTSCQSGKRVLTLKQERFTVNDSSPQFLQWQLPLSMSQVGMNSPVSYILLSQKTMTVHAGGCDSVVKLNAGNVGYLRVKYEPEMFNELVKAVDKIATADRLNLLSDTWALAEAAQGSATAYLDLVEAMREDTNLAVWEEILARLVYIDDLQVGDPVRERFQSYARSLLRPQLTRIGWDAKPGEEETIGLLRDRLITGLGRFEDEGVIAEARERFGKFLQNPQSLQPDLRQSVFYIVGRYSNRATYDQLHNLGRQSQNTEEKQRIYGALMGALDPTLAEKNLQIVLSDELPPEVAVYCLFGVAESGEHHELTMKFAQDHMKEFSDKLPSFASLSYIPNLFMVFSDAARATELEAFSMSNLVSEAQPDVAKAAESIRAKAAFKQRELPNIKQWVSMLQKAREDANAILH